MGSSNGVAVPYLLSSETTIKKYFFCCNMSIYHIQCAYEALLDVVIGSGVTLVHEVWNL